jgi:hypothetical protein
MKLLIMQLSSIERHIIPLTCMYIAEKANKMANTLLGVLYRVKKQACFVSFFKFGMEHFTKYCRTFTILIHVHEQQKNRFNLFHCWLFLRSLVCVSKVSDCYS